MFWLPRERETDSRCPPSPLCQPSLKDGQMAATSSLHPSCVLQVFNVKSVPCRASYDSFSPSWDSHHTTTEDVGFSYFSYMMIKMLYCCHHIHLSTKAQTNDNKNIKFVVGSSSNHSSLAGHLGSFISWWCWRGVKIADAPHVTIQR